MAAATASAGHRRFWSLAAKLGLTAGLMAVLLRRIDGADLLGRAAAIEPGWVVAAVLLGLGMVALSGLRWGVLAAAVGAPMPTGTTLRYTFVGQFFGQFLPAGLGNDAVRGLLACRNGLPLREVASGIFLDRVTGLLTLILLIGAAGPLLADRLPAAVALTVGLGAGITVAGIAVVLLADRLPGIKRLRQGRLGTLLSLTRHTRRTLRTRAALRALPLSLAVHLIIVAMVWLLAAGTGLAVSPADCLAVVPASVLFATLPISLNGWGVREGSMVVGFGLLGIGPEPALLISILLGLVQVVCALPGGLLWLLKPRRQAAPSPGAAPG